MTDITIGGGGPPHEIPPGIASVKTITFTRKIEKIDSSNYGFLSHEVISVEIELYGLEDRVVVEPTKVTSEDFLDSISDVETLKLLRYEIKNQAGKLKDTEANKSINEKINDFVGNCIKQIDDKLKKISNQPKESEQTIPEPNQQVTSDNPSKIAVPLSSQMLAAQCSTRILNDHVALFIRKEMEHARNQGIKALPQQPKTARPATKGRLAFWRSKGPSTEKNRNSQLFKQRRVVATASFRYFAPKFNQDSSTIISPKELPPWIRGRLSSPVQKFTPTALQQSFCSSSNQKAAWTTGLGSEGYVNTQSAISQPPPAEVIQPLPNHASPPQPPTPPSKQKEASENQQALKSQPADKPPLLPDKLPAAASALSQSIITQPTTNALQVEKSEALKQASRENSPKTSALQQLYNSLNRLGDLFEEDDQAANKIEYQTLDELKNRLERMRTAIKKFINQQLKQDPCQSQSLFNERLQAVKAFEERLGQNQYNLGVNAVVALLRDTLENLEVAEKTAAVDCHYRRVQLAKNLSHQAQ
jgi:hypothetical protein